MNKKETVSYCLDALKKGWSRQSRMFTEYDGKERTECGNWGDDTPAHYI